MAHHKNNGQKPTIESEVEQLTAKIKIEQEKRVKQFSEELKAISEKYKCSIIPIIHLSPDGIQAEIQLKAN